MARAGGGYRIIVAADFSLQSAIDAAREDRLGQWVADFLASPGSDNAVLAQQLSEESLSWLGPIEVPIHQLHRLAGPEGDPVLCEVDDDYWRDDVDDMAEQIEDGWEPPPLVARYRDGQLVLEDGNHRAEGSRRAGNETAWTVVGFEDDDQRDSFMAAFAG
jgi:hypothetical protein